LHDPDIDNAPFRGRVTTAGQNGSPIETDLNKNGTCIGQWFANAATIQSASAGLPVAVMMNFDHPIAVHGCDTGFAGAAIDQQPINCCHG
jgi:hypothetical protein